MLKYDLSVGYIRRVDLCIQARVKPEKKRKDFFWLIYIFLVIAELSRAQRSTMGEKIWLSMHSMNFGTEKIVRTSGRPYVRPPLHVSRGEILHFK